MQQSSKELRKSNLSEIPTSSFNCFMGKWENRKFRFFFSCCKICNNCPTISFLEIVGYSVTEQVLLMGLFPKWK